jgi:hypothetical protein
VKKPPRWGMRAFQAALLASDEPAKVSLYSRTLEIFPTMIHESDISFESFVKSDEEDLRWKSSSSFGEFDFRPAKKPRPPTILNASNSMTQLKSLISNPLEGLDERFSGIWESLRGAYAHSWSEELRIANISES